MNSMRCFRIINGADPAIFVLKEKITSVNPGFENIDIVRKPLLKLIKTISESQ